MRVVITEFMDEAALDQFGSGFDILYEPTLVDQPDQIQRQLENADAIIVRNRTQVDQALLDAAPNLKAVGRLGVGLDNIDLAACEHRKIEVLPATGANANSVAEYVITTAMLLTRGAYSANTEMIAGNWPRGALGKGGEIAGRTLGLVGFGGIAQLVAQKSMALGMKVVAFDPFLPEDHDAWKNVESLELDDLIRHADIVSLHIPLTEQTQNLIDANSISKFKDQAILINTARGGIVDESALVSALKDGKLGGAAIDVFEQEPLDQTNAERFADCPNLVLTPHIAGVAHEGNIRVSQVTVENVKRALLGE